MGDLFSTILFSALGVAIGWLFVRRLPAVEHRWLWFSLAAHVGAAFAKVLVAYGLYGGVSDMNSYLHFGRICAEFMEFDFTRAAPEYLKMTLMIGEPKPPFLPPGGTTSGPMFGIAAFYQLAFGASRYGISVFVAIFAFASKVAIYLALREKFPARYRQRLAVGVLLIPSAVYWSGSFSKEGVAYMAAGWVFYGFHLLLDKRKRLLGVAMMLAAGFVVSLVKPYILFPMVLGFAVWAYWQGTMATRREFNVLRGLVRVVLVVVFAVVSLNLLGEVFPRYSLDNVMDSTMELQERGSRHDGGAQYSLVGGSGVAAQLLATPFALVTALYRPFLFEAHNGLALVGALETSLFLLLTLFILSVGPLRVVERVRASPELMFCVVYVVLFGVATGLASTNLGTLSRYRMPMIPFLGVLFAILTPLPRTAASAVRGLQRRRPGSPAPNPPPTAASATPPPSSRRGPGADVRPTSGGGPRPQGQRRRRRVSEPSE